MTTRLVQIAIPFIWFGMIAAISFMEAPLKFQASGITLPLGLGIGRLVFFTLNKIEIAFALVLLVAFIRQMPKPRFPVLAFGVILLLLILQTVWLLPYLDERAEQVISGISPPFSALHLIYIGFEAVKFLLLFGLGISMARLHLVNSEQSN